MLSDVVDDAEEFTAITTGHRASVPELDTVTGEISAVNLVDSTAVPESVYVAKAESDAGVPIFSTVLPVVPEGTDALIAPLTTKQSGGIWNIYILSDADEDMVVTIFVCMRLVPT